MSASRFCLSASATATADKLPLALFLSPGRLRQGGREVLLAAEHLASVRQERRRERASGLTERQLTVLSLMARGLTNKEICGVLGIAEGTVKTHIAAVFEALDVTNRTEAAVLARELGLRLPDEE